MTGVIGSSTAPSISTPSTVQNISSTAVNTSGNWLLPSTPVELLTLPIRILHRAETFTFSTAPRHVARLTGLEGISVSFWSGVASTTGDRMADTSQAAGMAGERVAQAVGQTDSWYVAEFFHTARKVGGFFGYLTSVWSFACLVEVSALVILMASAKTCRPSYSTESLSMHRHGDTFDWDGKDGLLCGLFQSYFSPRK